MSTLHISGLRAAGGCLLLAATLMLASPIWAAGKITVSGEGIVSAVPDMATIMLGVTSQAETAAAALADNSTRVAAILSSLTSAGIETRDVQTSGLSLNPQFDYERLSKAQTPEILGYVVTNNVTVRIRDLPMLGGLLDQVVQGGANTFNGLTFGLADPGPALDEARAKAVADARRKAELYAAAAGAKVGPIVTLSENAGYADPAPMMRMSAEAASSPVPVVAGEMGVTATVTIEYELNQ